MIATLIILLLSAILFVSGRVRSDLVAICALLALLLCQVLTPAEGLSGFSNTTVIMMIGLFIVGGGIFQTGLAKMIGSKVMSLSGNSETRMFLLVMLVTGVYASHYPDCRCAGACLLRRCAGFGHGDHGEYRVCRTHARADLNFLYCTWIALRQSF